MDTKEKKCKIKKNEMHTRVSQSIERCRESIDKKPTLMDREAIENLSRRQEISQSIHLAIKRYRDYDKNQLKSLIDKPGVKEVSRLLKNNFSRKEKHIYECNQACNSTNDPINILYS